MNVSKTGNIFSRWNAEIGLSRSRIAYIVSLGIIMKYNSRNSARLKTNRNIFQIFDEYILCFPQGTLTQLNFCLQSNTKRRIKYTETNKHYYISYQEVQSSQ